MALQKIGKKGGEKRLAEARAARQPYEPQWFMNLAMFQGQQWLAWSGNGLYKPNTGDRVTITDNRIRPAVQAEVARVSKARPGWSATPRQLGDQAVSDALASMRVMDWAWDSFKMGRARRRAIRWSRITGAGFIKTVWDPNDQGGVDVVIGPDGKPLEHPTEKRPLYKGEMPAVESMQETTTKRIGGGNAKLFVRSPFDIYPDPLATSLDDARWIIDESVRSPEYVAETYNKQIEPDAAADVGIVESRMTRRGVDAARGPKAGIKVYEMWEAPSKTNPQGRRLVWCSGGVLYEGPNEYGRIPYTMFEGKEVPGRFWPDASVTDMVPIQVRLNMLESQIAENVSRFGNPALLIDALQDITVFGVPGEQIRHTAATQTQLPQYMEPPSMPGYVFNFLQQMETSLQASSIQSSGSEAAVPAGVTAASAISLIQEQSDTIIGPDVESLEDSIADVGQQVMDLLARFYTTERIIAIVGEDGMPNVDSWRGGAGYNTPEVRVVAYSTFPRSLAARQAAIRDMLNMFFQYGVPVDQTALTALMRDMQVGGLERVVGRATVDVSAATRENVDFLRGVEPVVRKIDNDAVHISQHEDFAKTPRFLEMDENQQAVWMKHIDDHHMQQAAEQPQGPPVPGAPQPPTVGPGAAPPPGTVPTYPSGNPLPAQDQTQIDPAANL